MGTPRLKIQDALYSPFQLATRYLRYWLTASSGRGHGIHSPLVFDFVTRVLPDQPSPSFGPVEEQRSLLSRDNSLLQVEDFGAGSRVLPHQSRTVKSIAGSSLKPARYARLLHRMVRHYQPATVLELGTSLGITSAYLARALPPGGRLVTCEGAPAIAARARQVFEALQLSRVRIVEGNFDVTLAPLLQELGNLDFAFIDGNHREEPTVHYFETLLPYCGPQTILVLDDIHWSAGMEAAWRRVCAHPAVTLTLDLFFIGIVFLNPDVKVPQHFRIRY